MEDTLARSLRDQTGHPYPKILRECNGVTLSLSLSLDVSPRILGRKVYFLPRRAMRPAVVFAELYHARVEREGVLVALSADANRRELVLAQWNLSSGEKREGGKGGREI